MHSSRPSARASLLLAAAALAAMLIAVPSANAATFGGGTIKVDLKSLKGASVTPKGHASKTSKGATFRFAADAGSATLNAQASGNLNIGTTTTAGLTLKRGKKSIVLASMVQKLKSGKGILAAKIGGKGKLVDFFDQASANRIVVDGSFTTLSMQTSKMTLTKAGAAALNKAWGLKGKSALKAKAAAGSSSFAADRALVVSGGQSDTIYDQAFSDQLKSCDITLGSVPDATAIPEETNSAPRGGVRLPVKSGLVNARTLLGEIRHSGGTVLDRPGPGQPGNTTGKAAYRSELNEFFFSFQPGQQILSSFVKNLNTRSATGTITGTLSATLNDAGGTLQLNGDLVLSDLAATLLSSADPPLGADCPIPPGSKIGRVAMTAQVN